MQKTDRALDFVRKLSEEERREDTMLSYGYDRENNVWQVIVKYIGNLQAIIERYPGTKAVQLYNGYGILTIREEYIDAVSQEAGIVYMEKPKRLYLDLFESREAVCVSQLQTGLESSLQLYGAGVLIGIVDSGIDIFHPAFRKGDGSTRIRYLWDQSSDGQSSLGRAVTEYGSGIEFTQNDINRILFEEDGESFSVPGVDLGTGHGTAVAGIAAGNGRGAVGNSSRGIAPESELIIVKTERGQEDFSGTTQVMEGMDYIIRKSLELGMPVAVNISFGTNEGAHDGGTLFEEYISGLKGIGQNTIVIAVGNEGDSRHHRQLLVTDTAMQNEEKQQLEFAVGARETRLYLQIWKNYADEIDIILESPQGESFVLPNEEGVVERRRLGQTEIAAYLGGPTPFSVKQQIFIQWFLEDGFADSGIWKLRFDGKRIRDGRVDLWLPTVEAIGVSTGFLEPSPNTTITIPSTARDVISVGAYDAETRSYASFSGRGRTADGRLVPDIVAPGVSIVTTAPGGRYQAQTGTSFSAPFVTGAAALLMEWGIVRGNDRYLYGEKVKAYLRKGARILGEREEPNEETGWGALCVAESIPERNF